MEQLELWRTPRPTDPATPDAEQRALALRLPRGVRLGTSSWSFPGWAGIVYTGRAPRGQLAREGLGAYAAHPLLRCVGIDRSYYAPPEPADLERYAASVSSDFRFLVKAPERCTLAHARRGQPGAGDANPTFLDAEWATRAFVEPTLRGLGGRAGPLVFQFPPTNPRALGTPERFAERLAAFLAALPAGGRYAVEIRTAAWLTPAYAAALRETGALHCLTVHPSMPSLDEQVRVAEVEAGSELVARWMLRAGLRYEEGRARYAPFDRIVDPDPATRDGLARLARHFAGSGREVTITVNNKAEGSAPLSVFALAQAIDATPGAGAEAERLTSARAARR